MGTLRGLQVPAAEEADDCASAGRQGVGLRSKPRRDAGRMAQGMTARSVSTLVSLGPRSARRARTRASIVALVRAFQG